MTSLGQFYPVASPVHDLDPRAKIVATAVLVPLTVGAFRRADELAEAMESRGYRGGEGRTRYRELRFRMRDALALCVTVLVLLIGVLL